MLLVGPQSSGPGPPTPRGIFCFFFKITNYMKIHFFRALDRISSDVVWKLWSENNKLYN